MDNLKSTTMLNILKIKALVLSICFSVSVFAQNSNVKPGLLENKISDFTLQSYHGDEFSMGKMKGKNVLLISSRGKYSDSNWCAICNYQYADFADLESKEKIREKYNLEIVFLMPYGKDELVNWEKYFSHAMEKIERWKYPANPDSLTTEQKKWMDYTRKVFPKTFVYPDDKVTLPFPVLMDDKHEVSTGLDLFRNEWDRGKTAQNIPAVYLIDKDSIIRFKYLSQNTLDRPSSEYILEMAKLLLK